MIINETSKILIPILKDLGFKQVVTRQDKIMFSIPDIKVIEYYDGDTWSIWVKK